MGSLREDCGKITGRLGRLQKERARPDRIPCAVRISQKLVRIPSRFGGKGRVREDDGKTLQEDYGKNYGKSVGDYGKSTGREVREDSGKTMGRV